MMTDAKSNLKKKSSWNVYVCLKANIIEIL